MNVRRVGRLALVAAALVVAVALILLVREVKRAPARSRSREDDRAETSPLTDVAGRSRQSLPASAHAPAPRTPGTTAGPGGPTIGADGRPAAAPPPYILPPDLPDPSSPPQWTEPLATPGEPRPPDPFVEPQVAQDPNRGGRTR